MRALRWDALNAVQQVGREASAVSALCQQVVMGTPGNSTQAVRLLPDALVRLKTEVDRALERLDARRQEP